MAPGRGVQPPLDMNVDIKQRRRLLRTCVDASVAVSFDDDVMFDVTPLRDVIVARDSRLQVAVAMSLLAI